MARPSEINSLCQMRPQLIFIDINPCEKLYGVLLLCITLAVAIFSWFYFLSNSRMTSEGNGYSGMLSVFMSDKSDKLQKLSTMLESENTSSGHKKDSTFGASFPVDDHNSLPKQDDVNALKEILKGITIPSRRLNITSGPVGTLKKNNNRYDVPVYPDCIYPGDLERFLIASNYDLRTAAMRLVQTSVFRGELFPINLESCQAEIQKFQIFSQGRDKELNPIIYFRVHCLGEWKKDFSATVAAATYQLESILQKELLSSTDKSDTEFTLIIWFGPPEVKENISIINSNQEKNQKEENVPFKQPSSIVHSNNRNNSTNKQKEIKKIWQSFIKKENESKNNKYFHHCNFIFAQRLIKLFLNHYPERLSKALVVPSSDTGLDLFWGKLGLRAYASPSHTRDKVLVLKGHEDLKKYISVDELVVWCGGNAPIIKKELTE